LRRAPAPEERTDRVDRDQIDRVRVQQTRLEHPGIETRRPRPPAVLELDPPAMDVAQPIRGAREGVHDRGNPWSRLEPRTHRADQTQPGGIRELPPPADLVLDHPPPEGDGAHDAWWRPCGPRTLALIQRTARVDAAAAADVRRLVASSPDLQDRWNAAPCRHHLHRLPDIAHARARGKEAGRRCVVREVPDAPADDRFVSPLDGVPIRCHEAIVWRAEACDKRRMSKFCGAVMSIGSPSDTISAGSKLPLVPPTGAPPRLPTALL